VKSLYKNLTSWAYVRGVKPHTLWLYKRAHEQNLSFYDISTRNFRFKKKLNQIIRKHCITADNHFPIEILTAND